MAQETAEQRKARVLSSTKALLPRAVRGERAEEIIEKGEALAEIKELQPWRYDGSGHFKEWCRQNLPYQMARANQYIAIAQGVDADRVAGKRITLQHLLVVQSAPQDMHQELIDAADGGASAAELRRLLKGELPGAEKGPEERAEQIVRHQRRQAALLHELLEQIAQIDQIAGAALSAEALEKLKEGVALQHKLVQALCGEQMDPRGSVQGAAPSSRQEQAAPSPAASPAPAPSPAPTAPPAPAPAAPAPTPKADPPRSAQTGLAAQTAEDIRLRNLRLCAPYEPEPLREQLTLIAPDDWPDNWRQEWVDQPADNDPIVLCTDERSVQFGTLGWTLQCDTLDADYLVAIDLDGSFCAHFYSNPGAGKTYTCDIIMHMSLAKIVNVNILRSPLCAVQVHYHSDDTHDPESLSLRHANNNHREMISLIEDLGSMPAGLQDIVLLCFASRVETMRRRYPHVLVLPLLFSTDELGNDEIQTLLGINDPNDTRLYTRQIRSALQGLQGIAHPSLEQLKDKLLAADLSAESRNLVQARFDLILPHICDDYPLRRLPRPGRLIVIDVRDAWTGKQDALTLGALGLKVLSRRDEQRPFNMVVRVDELHEYLEHPVFCPLLEMFSRKRRHLGLSLLFSTQFPQHVKKEMLNNADLVGVGRMQSEEALRHLSKVKTAFSDVTAENTSALGDGQMLIWSERVWAEFEYESDPDSEEEDDDENDDDENDDDDEQEIPEILTVQIRPQNARHGGATRRAVQPAVPPPPDPSLEKDKKKP